jgi:hypothetical protein
MLDRMEITVPGPSVPKGGIPQHTALTVDRDQHRIADTLPLG